MDKFTSESEKVLVTQSCLTLCYPMHYSPRGSSVHGISQASILEWVVISFSNEVLLLCYFIYFLFEPCGL